MKNMSDTDHLSLFERFKNLSEGYPMLELDVNQAPLTAEQWSAVRMTVQRQSLRAREVTAAVRAVFGAVFLSILFVATVDGGHNSLMHVLLFCASVIAVVGLIECDTLLKPWLIQWVPMHGFMGVFGPAIFDEIPVKDYPAVSAFAEGDPLSMDYLNRILDQHRVPNRIEFGSMQDRFYRHIAERAVTDMRSDLHKRWLALQHH